MRGWGGIAGNRSENAGNQGGNAGNGGENEGIWMGMRGMQAIGWECGESGWK